MCAWVSTSHSLLCFTFAAVTLFYGGAPLPGSVLWDFLGRTLTPVTPPGSPYYTFVASCVNPDDAKNANAIMDAVQAAGRTTFAAAQAAYHAAFEFEYAFAAAASARV